jgi:hypothetical protein
VIDGVTAPDTAQNEVLLMQAVRWNQDGNRFANRLLSQVAEEPLGALRRLHHQLLVPTPLRRWRPVLSTPLRLS